MHEIETSFYAGETPWHGLGVYVGDEDVDSKTAIIKAGLDWQVEERKLFAGKSFSDVVNNYVEVESSKALIRATDNRVLGVVGSKYVPVQNDKAFEFLDGLVEEGSMKYHTAGSLRNGQRIWVLAKIGQSEIVPNDLIDKYLFLWNTHDGSGALRCLFTNVRVVCANTAKMALRDGRGEGVYLRHTTNIKARMEKAREILGIAHQESSKFDEFAKHLSGYTMDVDRWKQFSEMVIPEPEGKNSQRGITLRKNSRAKLEQLFQEGRGSDINGVRGTGWGAYCSLVEFVNYHRQSKGKSAQESRFEGSLFGSGAKLIQTGVDSLVKLAS